MNRQKLKNYFETMYRLNIGLKIDETLLYKAINEIFGEQNKFSRNNFLISLLSGLMIRGPKFQEIIALIKASLELDDMADFLSKEKLKTSKRIIGVAGSGKKGFKTINISTPACIVAAASGANIAKVCSHATSSLSGSSDFLRYLRIDLSKNTDELNKILINHGLAFYSVEKTTPNFAEIYGGVFHFPHAMSFALAGLSFPIYVDVLAYGLAHPNIDLSLNVLKNSIENEICVYTSSEDNIHYIDEIGINGKTRIIHGGKKLETSRMELNLNKECKFSKNFTFTDIQEKDNMESNINAVISALRGNGEEAITNTIALNAGLYIYLSKLVVNIYDGYKMAMKTIRSGKAIEYLHKTVELFNGDVTKLRC